MSKYGNQEKIVCGISFQSKKEGNYYLELLGLEASGEVSDIEMQVPFNYMSDDGKKKLFTYKADFVYKDILGHKKVVDVKGFKTSIYKLKKKLIEDRFKIKIIEV